MPRLGAQSRSPAGDWPVAEDGGEVAGDGQEPFLVGCGEVGEDDGDLVLVLLPAEALGFEPGLGDGDEGAAPVGGVGVAHSGDPPTSCPDSRRPGRGNRVAAVVDPVPGTVPCRRRCQALGEAVIGEPGHPGPG
jgi:hypothetical protein